MANETVVDVMCPCCGEVMRIDVAQRRVVAHRNAGAPDAAGKAAEDPLASAVRARQSTGERARIEFQAAKERVQKGGGELERLFEQAKKKTALGKDGLTNDDVTKRWD